MDIKKLRLISTVAALSSIVTLSGCGLDKPSKQADPKLAGESNAEKNPAKADAQTNTGTSTNVQPAGEQKTGNTPATPS